MIPLGGDDISTTSKASPIITDEMRATQQAELKEGLTMIMTGVTRLRESHDALLAAAKYMVSTYDGKIVAYGIIDLRKVKAAIARAERSAP